MKKSLDHLPYNKIGELQRLVTEIRKTSKDVDKIILFGSYARGDYKEIGDLASDRKTGHISDYDILIVTGNKKTAEKFKIWDKKFDFTAPVRIIASDIRNLNINLAEGHYLFSDIKKEGVMLYDDKRYELAEKEDLSSEERKRVAQKYFDHWFAIATGFYEHFEIGLLKIDDTKNNKASGLAAFHLHQAIEHCYKAIFLVFINYNPNEHYLDELIKMSEKYHPKLKDVFIRNTEEEKKRFKNLDYAYIGGRYDPDYYIAKEDLLFLAKQTKAFMNIAKEICEEKMEHFAKD